MLFDFSKYKVILKASCPGTQFSFAESGLYSEFKMEDKIEQCSMSAMSGHFFQDSRTKCYKTWA